MTDRELMQAAIALAREAAADGEVPVGAVVAKDGEIVSVGRNRREKDKNALAHAEIEAIDKACRALGLHSYSERKSFCPHRLRRRGARKAHGALSQGDCGRENRARIRGGDSSSFRPCRRA